MKNILSYDDLQSIAEQLDGMLNKHVDWLSSLHKVMLCQLPSHSLKINSHDCDFGQWYNTVDNISIRETPGFSHLGTAHENLHQTAHQLIEKYDDNKTPSEHEYELFAAGEKQFFEILNKFIDNVLATKNQFDHLTNIPNRCLVSLMLEKEYSKFLRDTNTPYSIAFADLDFFKHINDTFGHETGDIVLQNVSKIFSEEIRPFDTMGRYGGEEFIFCFPHTSINDATLILERIRSKLEISPIHIDESNQITVTCSFGIAVMQKDLPLKESIKRADEAQYLAKYHGRNRIEIWDNTNE